MRGTSKKSGDLVDVQNFYPIFQSSSSKGMVEIKHKIVILDVTHETKTLLAWFCFYFEERAFLELFALGKFFERNSKDSGLIKLTEGIFRLE